MQIMLNDGLELEIRENEWVYSGYENGPAVFCRWHKLSVKMQELFIKIKNGIAALVDTVPELEGCEE